MEGVVTVSSLRATASPSRQDRPRILANDLSRYRPQLPGLIVAFLEHILSPKNKGLLGEIRRGENPEESSFCQSIFIRGCTSVSGCWPKDRAMSQTALSLFPSGKWPRLCYPRFALDFQKCELTVTVSATESEAPKMPRATGLQERNFTKSLVGIHTLDFPHLCFALNFFFSDWERPQ